MTIKVRTAIIMNSLFWWISI